MVLATDMANHHTSFNTLAQIADQIKDNIDDISNSNQTIQFEEDMRANNKVFIMSQCLHVADITNPCRTWTVC